jgi:hypothetical protein
MDPYSFDLLRFAVEEFSRKITGFGVSNKTEDN